MQSGVPAAMFGDILRCQCDTALALITALSMDLKYGSNDGAGCRDICLVSSQDKGGLKGGL